MSFRASQGGGGQAVSSETGTPPKAHCARLLSLTRPIFSCFLFSHSSAICCSNGKRALCSQRLRYKAHLIMETVFFPVLYFQFLPCAVWFNFNLMCICLKQQGHDLWNLHLIIVCRDLCHHPDCVKSKSLLWPICTVNLSSSGTAVYIWSTDTKYLWHP